MGNHLETPKDSKETEFYELETSTSVVVSKMQGWQKEMCHAHHVAPAVPPRMGDVSQAALEGYPSWSYLALFEGHGGQEVADHARRSLHGHVAKQLEKHGIKQEIGVEDEASVRDALKQAFTDLDKEVCEKFPPPEGTPQGSSKRRIKASSPPTASRALPSGSSDERPDASAPPASLGSSALVLLLTPKALVVASVGTSRAVLASEGFLLQLTREHRPTDKDEQERIRKAGGDVVHDRVSKPNAPVLAVSRAIGDAAFKLAPRAASSASVGSVSSPRRAGEPIVSAEPDVFVIKRKPKHDEFVLLASDGVANALSNDEACFFLRHALHNNGLTPLSLPDDEREAAAGPDVGGKGEKEDEKAAEKRRTDAAKRAEREAGKWAGEAGLHTIAEALLAECLLRQSRDALTAMLVVFDGAWEPSAHVHISARYVERWAKADVRQYLAAIGFEEEAAALERENIDGAKLLQLDEDDILKLDVKTSVGDRDGIRGKSDRTLNAMVGRRKKLMGKLRALRSGYIAWNVDEVARWLRHHRLSDMEDGFRQATIDGPKLARLNDPDLRALFRRRPIAKGKVEKLRRVLANLRVHGEGGDMNFLYASANSADGQQGDADAHDGGTAGQ